MSTIYRDEPMIAHRTKALAMVGLTRRPDVSPVEFPLEHLDHFAQILTGIGKDHVSRAIGFGVALAGTLGPLPTVKAASQRIHSEWGRPDRPRVRFYFPVIGLLFSMENDKGYYTWLAKPLVSSDNDHPVLYYPTDFECWPFTAMALDNIVDATRKWYSALDQSFFLGDE